MTLTRTSKLLVNFSVVKVRIFKLHSGQSVEPVSYTHLDVYKRQITYIEMCIVICINYFVEQLSLQSTCNVGVRNTKLKALNDVDKSVSKLVNHIVLELNVGDKHDY